MALFRRKKKEENQAAAEGSAAEASVSNAPSVQSTPRKKRAAAGGYFGILRRPRITEKATEMAERGVYVFEVAPRANKKEITKAVHSFYNVTPAKVRITPIPEKTVMDRARRTRGTKTGGKKAYVYLKKGDTIELI